MRSLKTRFGLVAAVCALGAFGFAGQASAFTLEDSSNNPVTAGSTATATLVSGDTLDLTGQTPIGPFTNSCTTASLTAKENTTGSTTDLSVTGASFGVGGSCSPFSASANHLSWGPFQTTGTQYTDGGYGLELDNVDVTVGPEQFTGNVVDDGLNETFVWYNAADAPHCSGPEIDLNGAGTLNSTDGFVTNGTITGNLCVDQSWHIV